MIFKTKRRQTAAVYVFVAVELVYTFFGEANR